jgi:hypothetical protein
MTPNEADRRDQRSLEAAGRGMAVSSRLAFLRWLDPAVPARAEHNSSRASRTLRRGTIATAVVGGIAVAGSRPAVEAWIHAVIHAF